MGTGINVEFEENLRKVVSDNVVDNIAKHLNDLVTAGGIAVFDSLCKENLESSQRIYDGRLFFRATINQQTLKVDPPPIEMDADKVSIIDKMSNEGKAFDVLLKRVATILMQNPDITNIISQYDTHYPGGGDKLARFIASEGAYTIFEAAQRKKNENLPCNLEYERTFQQKEQVSRQMRDAEKQITVLTTKIEELENTTPNAENKKAIKDSLSKMKKQMHDIAKEIHKLAKEKDKHNKKIDSLTNKRLEEKSKMDKTLITARSQAKDYREGRQEVTARAKL